jgi:anti-sigma factor RsiW
LKHPDHDLLPFAFGELDAAGRERVARHLRECADCERELAALRSLARTLPRALAPPADSVVAARRRLDRQLGQISQTPVLRLRERLWLGSAALAAAVLLLMLLRPYVDLTPPALPASLQDLDRHAISRFIQDRLPRLPLVKERTGA